MEPSTPSSLHPKSNFCCSLVLEIVDKNCPVGLKHCKNYTGKINKSETQAHIGWKDIKAWPVTNHSLHHVASCPPAGLWPAGVVWPKWLQEAESRPGSLGRAGPCSGRGESKWLGWACGGCIGGRGRVLATAMVVSPLGLPPTIVPRALLLIGVLWNWLSRAQQFLGTGPDWSHCFN